MKNKIIDVENLEITYDTRIVLKDIQFTVEKGDIFVIMGPSGCGKTTLLRTLVGLIHPKKGKIEILGVPFLNSSEQEKNKILHECGVLYQGGALFSSMTLGENIALPLEQFTSYSKEMIKEIVQLKLALVGLKGYEDFYPAEISGGMKKRVGLARALALDPKIVYFDEPSAGLDPISSRLLDDLILEINQSLGTTIVLVTHELSSIFAVGKNSIFLDPNKKTITGRGKPKELLKNPPNALIENFLTRGEKND